MSLLDTDFGGAMLEILLQDELLRTRCVISEARIPGGLKIECINIEAFPADWRDIPEREKLQVIGTDGRGNAALPRLRRRAR